MVDKKDFFISRSFELQFLTCDIALDSIPEIMNAYRSLQEKNYVQLLLHGHPNNISPVIGKGTYGLRIRLNFHTTLFPGNMKQIEYSFAGLSTDSQFTRLLNLQLMLFQYAIKCFQNKDPLKSSR